LNYVDLMREFDKAQLRLLVLTGLNAQSPQSTPAKTPPQTLPEK